MSAFTMPVHWYMTAPVHTIHQDITLNALHHRFLARRVSSLPVIDDDEKMVGVVSRTDLLRQSLTRREAAPDAPLLVIPDQPVRDIMSPWPITVRSHDTVAEAATLMVRERIHRVYVSDSGHLVGVLSARDVMPAVVDLRITEPIGRYMSRPLFVVGSDEELHHATSFLETTHVSGVVVLGAAGPLGVYTQAEAIECRSLPRTSQVRDAMDTEIVTVLEETPLYRVVAEAIERKVRRMVVTARPYKDEDAKPEKKPKREDSSARVRGIVTSLDILEAVR